MAAKPAAAPPKPPPLPRLRAGAYRAARGTVFWLGFVILLFLAGNSLLFISYFTLEYTEIVHYGWRPVLPLVGFCVAAAAALYLCWRHRVWNRIGLAAMEKWLLIFVAVAGTGWIFLTRAEPVYDQAMLWGDARAFVAGDWAPLEPNGYSGAHPYQLGMVLYLEAITWLAGDYNIFLVQMLNVGFLILAYHFFIGLVRQLFRDNGVVFLFILLLFAFPQPILYTNFIYGQIPGLACALFAMGQAARYCATGRWALLPGAAIGCGLACVFKSNYLIFAVAIAIVLAVRFVQKPNPAALTGAAAVLLAALFAMQPIYLFYEARSGKDIPQGIPMAGYLAMGLHDNSIMAPGWYNYYQEDIYIRENFDHDATAEVALDKIGELADKMAADPAYTADFFYHKTVSQWNEPTFESLLVSHYVGQHQAALSPLARSVYAGDLYRLLTGWMAVVHTVVLAGAAVCLWLGRKKLSLPRLLPLLCVVGGFIFHTFWEGKSQYIWPYFTLLLPYCAVGLRQSVALWGPKAGRLFARLPGLRRRGHTGAGRRHGKTV